MPGSIICAILPRHKQDGPEALSSLKLRINVLAELVRVPLRVPRATAASPCELPAEPQPFAMFTRHLREMK